MLSHKCIICDKCYFGKECLACKGKMHRDEPIKKPIKETKVDLPPEFDILFKGFNR